MDSYLILTGVIAAFTVLNVWVMYRQWQVLVASTSLQQQVIDRETSPFLAVTSTRIRNNEGQLSWDIESEFKNFGKVPALHIEEEIKLFIGGVEARAEPTRSKPYLLVPDVARTLIVSLTKLTDMDAVLKQGKQVEVTVRFHYRDAQDRRYSFYQRDSYDLKVSRFQTVENSHHAPGAPHLPQSTNVGIPDLC